MRHRVKKLKLGRRSAHVRSLLANQVSSLILEGQIKTTVEKAKASRRLADKMVTLAKKGSLADRRRAIAKIRNKDAVAKLFAEANETFASRNGGYTRIIRLGTRRGDAAEMCILQWVTNEVETSPKTKVDTKTVVTEEESAVEEVSSETVTEVEETEQANAETESEEASVEQGEDSTSVEEASTDTISEENSEEK